MLEHHLKLTEALPHTLPIAAAQDFIDGPSLLDKHQDSYSDSLDAGFGPIILECSHGQSCAASFRSGQFEYAI